MRATASAAFLLTLVGICGVAHAGLPRLLAPKVSLALTRDWKSITVTQRAMSPLAVTSGAQAPAQAGVAAYGRAEGLVRTVVCPYRSLAVLPFSPYVGAYGLSITVETNGLLR